MRPIITGFIIAIVLISFFSGMFAIAIGELAVNYGVTYDNESLESYNQFENLTSQTKDIEEATNIKEKTGILDVIGGYFSGGYSALKLTGRSLNIFTSMTDQAIEDADLGSTGTLLRQTVILIAMVLVFVGIFIGAIMKWYL